VSPTTDAPCPPESVATDPVELAGATAATEVAVPTPSRRRALRAGSVVGTVGALAAVGLVGAPGAEAAPRRRKGKGRKRGGTKAQGRSAAVPGKPRRYRPGRYVGEPLLPAADLHLVRRFSYGVTPALTRQVRSRGGARAWFEWQLRPDLVADTAGDRLAAWWPSMALGPGELWQRQQSGTEGGWVVMTSYQRWLLNRRIHSQRQLAERMAEFWMAHLHVPAHHDGVFTHRVDYDRVVRRNALGSFRDLLQATTVHPAMSIFLDGAVSTKAKPNENLGRELLELHTVGRGAYTEDDVKASARLLTGFKVDLWRTWESSYSTKDHWTGPVRVMGFSHPNADADGRGAVDDYLAYLAGHPLTAERIARKLAVAFVADDPSPALVSRLAKVYLDSDTAIVPVLRALVASDEFARSSGSKVRDPSEDVVATYRALQVKIGDPGSASSDAAANAMSWQAGSIGAVPCDWPRPDGPPLRGDAWSSPARMLASMDVHWVLSGGWWPKNAATYKTPVQWMPAASMRFDLLVDHLCQQLLGRPSTADLLDACCQVTEQSPMMRPGTVITRDHPVVRWGFHRLLATILDSPHHLTR